MFGSAGGTNQRMLPAILRVMEFEVGASGAVPDAHGQMPGLRRVGRG